MVMDKTQTEQDTTPATKDVTPAVTETSPAKVETPPVEAPKTHTMKEVQELVQLARMDRGRELKEIEVERDGFKLQFQNITSQIEELNETITKLEAREDDLTSNDPRKFDAVKELREARADRLALKTDRQVLEAEKKTHGERLELAETTLREIAFWEISSNYEGGDPVKLKELCELFTATSDEQISKVADTVWAKKPAEPKAPETTPLVPFSGRTSGGGGFTPDKTKPDETLKEGFRLAKK